MKINAYHRIRDSIRSVQAQVDGLTRRSGVEAAYGPPEDRRVWLEVHRIAKEMQISVNSAHKRTEDAAPKQTPDRQS